MFDIIREDLKANSNLGAISKVIIVTYRFGNWTHYQCSNRIIKKVLWFLYKCMYFLSSNIIGNCEIPATVRIGRGIRLYHSARNVIMHPDCVIGDNATILHEVTIGSTFTKNGVPTIGDNVFFGVGCKVLGEITIGDNVNIGANAVVTRSIPSNCNAIGIPAKAINKTNHEQ